MRKKLFTLMMLTLMSIGSAWGDDVTILSFSGGTLTGATAAYTAKGTLDTNKYKLESTDNTASEKYVELTLTSGTFQTDDKISITYYASNTSKTVNPGLFFGTKAGDTFTTNSSIQAGESSAGSSSPATVNTLKVLEAGNGSNVLRLTRYAGSTTLYITALTITRPETRTISTQTLSGVKVDGTALTLDSPTNGYSVSGTTITLSDYIQYLTTPADITLTNHITYTDTSTDDKDVAVTFDGTVTDGYYIGTATIGTTDYTVKAKKNTTPTLTLSSASGTISLKSYQPTGAVKVTVTGTNLANGTFTAPTASGVTVAPASVDIADGTINQEFTITSSATTAASTVLAFAYTGAATQDYTLNYTKTAQRSLAQSDVSAATTWDWSKAYDAADVTLTEATSPTKSEEFLLSNLAEVKNDANFNAQALSVVCEFATRKYNDDYMLQGNSVKFNTTVPGTIKVVFSNTGGNRPYRYLTVNDEPTEFKSKTATKVTSGGIYVPAGEVVLGSLLGSSDGDDCVPTSTASMLRFYKIEFEPLADADAVTVSSAGYATVVLTEDAYFEATPEVTAYAAKAAGTKVTLTEVKAAPAGTPLVIKAAAGSYTLKKASTISPAAVSTDINDLMAGPVTDSDGTNYYVLGKEGSKVGFGLLASGTELPATKAYIAASKFAGAPGFITIEGADDDSDITTGISAIEHSSLNIEHSEVYNLNGQRVSQPTKGLYIVNGKKVVVK